MEFNGFCLGPWGWRGPLELEGKRKVPDHEREEALRKAGGTLRAAATPSYELS